MYGLLPSTPMVVRHSKEKLQFVKYFLQDMHDMQKFAHDDIQNVEDCARSYANTSHRRRRLC